MLDDATRRRLTADCSQCVALCCVGPGFTASADFAITKPAGRPCPNLRQDFGCGIHDRLRRNGFAGCTTYDCFGAGQRVTQHLFPGQDWRDPQVAPALFDALTVLRQLHELLWYLAEAQERCPDDALSAELRASRGGIETLAAQPAAGLRGLDVAPHRHGVGVLLARTSALVRLGGAAPGGEDRAGADRAGGDLAGADLAGADLAGADRAGAALRGADLRAAGLRGAVLIGADLRGADLRQADLLGADLRAADLRGADLREALFLLQSQLESATGDEATRVPGRLVRPAHWGSPDPAGRIRRR